MTSTKRSLNSFSSHASTTSTNARSTPRSSYTTPPSFDMAAKVADFYHLPGLMEKFGVLKSTREEHDRSRDARAQRREWKETSISQCRIPGRSTSGMDEARRGDPFKQRTAHTAIHRPRLSAATPLVRAISVFPGTLLLSTRKNTGSRQRSQEENGASPPPEKRKRDEVEDGAESSDASKRRALTETTSEGRTASEFDFTSIKDH